MDLICGVPHPCNGRVYICNKEKEPTETEFTDFEAWITGREKEVRRLADFGNWYYQGWGYSIEVGNFPTDWKVGEDLNIRLFVDGYESVVTSLTLKANSLDTFPDIILIGGPDCNLSLKNFKCAVQSRNVVISWITKSEKELQEFELFKDDILINETQATNTTETQQYQFIDKDNITDEETYKYTLKAVNLDSTVINLGEIEFYVDILFTDDYEGDTILYDVFPNPVNYGQEQMIKFAVKVGEIAELSVINTDGKIVESFEFTGGEYEHRWQPDYPTGLYMYKLESKDYSEVRKNMFFNSQTEN